MGAQERRRWSSLVRQEILGAIVAHLHDPALYGAAIIGPRGVGKTTMAHGVEARIQGTTHVINIFGTGSATDSPYGALSVLMATLSGYESESPTTTMHKLTELIKQEAQGRPTVIMLDDLPGIDTESVGLLVQLLMTGTVKLLVMARSLSELPDDLAWMIKDGRLATERVNDFTRAETRTLLKKALDGPVAESVVSSLFELSAGNPLVLQALVHENLTRGALRKRGVVWVLEGPRQEATENILDDLVEARLLGLPQSARTDLEKLALLRTVSLSVALQVLGTDVVSELEELSLLSVSPGPNSLVSFTEPFMGESLRERLSPVEKAQRFQEMSQVITLDPAAVDKHHLLAFAAWANDAGLSLKPKTALAAAQAALVSFDPQLALACSAGIPREHPRAVKAAQIRSRAYHLLANYPLAVTALDSIDPQNLAHLSLKKYSSWACALISSLLWVPEGYSRIEAVLAVLDARIAAAHTEADRKDEDLKKAEKYRRLAYFEFQVHRGEFALVAQELEDGSRDPSDRSYRLNCASLLVLVLAVTGRELDAIALSEAINLEAAEYDLVLRMREWSVHGIFFGLIWTGQWRACESLVKHAAEISSMTRHGGGVMELALGIVYAYTGRAEQAADMLLIAAAQLEVRDTYNSSALVYSALAFSCAQLDDLPNAHSYLAKARELEPWTLWVNRSLAEFFQLMALRWFEDPSAIEKLMARGEADRAKGRFATASMNLFGAATYGKDEVFLLLEEVSLMRQGPMAAIKLALARAYQSQSAAMALAAADMAHNLELPAVESRCVITALEIAHIAGDLTESREAQHRLELLVSQVPVLPLVPNNSVVPLTIRERQIVALASRGLANREIADRIGVSIRTVEGHLYQVFAKLGITSRSELEQRKD